MRFRPEIAATLILLWFGADAIAATCTPDNTLSQYKNKFVCPVSGGGQVRAKGDVCAKTGGRFSSTRGDDNHRHNALDINASEGTGVVAVKPGKVTVAQNNWDSDNGGTTVIIDHEDGDYTIYMHLKSVGVKKNDCVKAGTAIGTVGYTGNAACLKKNDLVAHLHFQIIRAAKTGLTDAPSHPLTKAIKNGQDWLDLAPEFFGNDMLDLGIKDPEPILNNVAGCLK